LPPYEASRKQGANRSEVRGNGPLKDRTVNGGTVTDAQNAIRVTRQIGMGQKQCGCATTP
jgi:hypothetical protein